MQLIKSLSLTLLMSGAALVGTTHAQLPPETLGQEELPFPPDPHRSYIVDFEFNNMIATRVVVVDPDEQKMLGMISTGGAAPAVLSNDQETVFTADIFYERYVRGDRTDVITAWDTSTLSPKWEVEIPPKRAVTLTERYALSVSEDDRFVYVWNFSPSSSVTIVDTEKQEVVNELPIGGCILNYPVGDRRFASLCGSGALQLITLDDEGQEIDRQITPFFEPDEEKLVERSVRLGDTFYFTTTEGQVHSVDLSGGTPNVLPTWSLTTEEEKEAGWAPGGWQLMAIAPELNRLYVLMHPDHQPQNWEDPSQIIWVFDLETKKKIGVLESPNLIWSLNATSDEDPLLLGTNIEGGLEIFDLSENQSESQHSGTMEGVTKTPTLVLNH